LLKDPDARPTPKELLVSALEVCFLWRTVSADRDVQNRQWMVDTKKKDVDLVAWAATF